MRKSVSQSKGGLSVSQLKKGSKQMSKASKSKSDSTVNVAVPSAGALKVPLSRIIIDDKFNARTQGMDEESIKDFAKTIKDGLLQPVVVEPMDNGDFYLKAGFRRVAAAKYLGWDSIDAMVKLADGKDKKEQELSRYFDNLAENVARQNLTPYDLAMRCKMLKRDFGLTGGQVAARINKSTGYINNLLAVVGEGEKGERKGATLHPDIMRRWQEECSWPDDDKRTKVCTIDQMKRWLTLSHDEQMVKFNREMYRAEHPNADMEKYDAKLKEGASDGAGTGGSDDKAADKVRATKSQLEQALESVKLALKEGKLQKEQITRYNGIQEGLEFALGVKPGYTNRIKGVIAIKEGKVIEGALAAN